MQRAGEALLASIHVDSAKQAQRLDELLGGAGGDVARGQTVFNGAKATCLSCHAIGYIGGRIGPDLTKIGQVRSERDLLEAVVFPNASFARGFEPVIVRTRSGTLQSGVLRSDAPDEIVLSPSPARTCASRGEISPRSSPARYPSCRQDTASCSRGRNWRICWRS